jgi:hypothetical protein
VSIKRIAIVQSNYIPWKGYFDLIDAVDEFVLYDDMQYTRRDWRNRNQIKTPQGVQWLTVPVKVKGKYLQTIRETEIDGHEWAHSHWKSLQQNYAKTRYFQSYAPALEALYLGKNYTYLCDLNLALLRWVAMQMGIETPLTLSSDYRLSGDRSEKLLNVCIQAGANEYISGPSARDYLDERMFIEAGISVRWFDYPTYPEYPQLWGPFAHGVTILDLIFNCGPKAADFALLNRRQKT